MGIDPLPRFSGDTQEGTLEYSRRARRFIITLGRQYRTSVQASRRLLTTDAELDSPTDKELIYRARFTYAHEVAHRFFFVQSPPHWERALGLAAETTSTPSSARSFQKLHNQEEEICNRVASDVLLPTDLAEAHLAGASPFSEDPIATIAHLRSLSGRFFVSMPVALVRVARLIRQGRVSVPDGFAFLLVSQDDRVGSLYGRLALRARISFVPERVDGQRIRHVFPGFEVRSLGSDFANLIERASAQSRGSRFGGLDTTVLLPSIGGGGTPPLTTRFRALWCAIDRLSKSSRRSRVLVWGRLGDSGETIPRASDPRPTLF
jgi:hypothetical protein